jgi:hypothetical protein
LVVPVPGSTSRVSGFGVVGVREDAFSFFKVVSFEAGEAVSVFSVRSTKVRNGGTDFFSVENPTLRAGKADLVVPVPGSAARVRRMSVVEFTEKALSVGEVIASVAAFTVSILEVGLALVRNGHTDVFRVEEPVSRAFQAFLVVPVPGSAAQIRRLGVVGVRKDALSVFEVVSFEAGEAVSVFSVGSAVVRNSNANSVSIEDPSAGAGQTFLIVPVPGSAARVSGFGVVGVREETLSVFEVVSLEA